VIGSFPGRRCRQRRPVSVKTHPAPDDGFHFFLGQSGFSHVASIYKNAY